MAYASDGRHNKQAGDTGIYLAKLDPAVERTSVAPMPFDLVQEAPSLLPAYNDPPERDRDRHLLDHQVGDADRAEIALAEIKSRIVPHHLQLPLPGGLVEPELRLELCDELGRQATGAQILVVAAKGLSAAPAPCIATAADGLEHIALPFEIGNEFGGLGPAPSFPPPGTPKLKGAAGRNTPIGIVATDASLTPAQCTRLAIAAHDGLARALMPAHTPLDGDLIFAAATGRAAMDDPIRDTTLLGHAAALCVSRAIARAVFAATPAPKDDLPCWSSQANL